MRSKETKRCEHHCIGEKLVINIVLTSLSLSLRRVKYLGLDFMWTEDHLSADVLDERRQVGDPLCDAALEEVMNDPEGGAAESASVSVDGGEGGSVLVAAESGRDN